MKVLTSILKKSVLLILFGGLLYGVFTYYSYIFSRTVIGRIDNVARVTGVTAMIGGSRTLTESQLHMFSVSIRQPNGEMVTAISEDGQWAIAKAGLCVKAKYYPHPPWNLKQAGTYFNARMLSMADCTSRAAQEMGIDSSAYIGVPLNPVVEEAPQPMLDAAASANSVETVERAIVPSTTATSAVAPQPAQSPTKSK